VTINILLLIVGFIGLVFSLRMLRFLRRIKNISLETYSNNIPTQLKQEIDARNRQRIFNLW